MKFSAREIRLVIIFVIGIGLIVYVRNKRMHQQQIQQQINDEQAPTETAPVKRTEFLPAPAKSHVALAQPENEPSEIAGIGVELEKDAAGRGVAIRNILPNTSAAKAGLSGGLIIQKIDGMLASELNVKQCADLIRGPVGTQIQLELLDPEAHSSRVVSLARERILLMRNQNAVPL